MPLKRVFPFDGRKRGERPFRQRGVSFGLLADVRIEGLDDAEVIQDVWLKLQEVRWLI